MALGSSTNTSAPSLGPPDTSGTARGQLAEDLGPANVEAPLAQVVPTTTVQFAVILVALIFAIFCVALDNTIIVTAIPRITDGYRRLNDVGW